MFYDNDIRFALYASLKTKVTEFVFFNFIIYPHRVFVKHKNKKITPHIKYGVIAKTELVCRIRKQSKVTGTLDSNREVTLVSCTSACYTARKNLSSLRHITAKMCNVFIVNMFNLVNTKSANFLARLSAAVVWSFCHSEVLLSNENYFKSLIV